MYNTQILITSSIQTDFDHQSNIYNYKVQNISSTSNLIKKKKLAHRIPRASYNWTKNEQANLTRLRTDKYKICSIQVLKALITILFDYFVRLFQCLMKKVLYPISLRPGLSVYVHFSSWEVSCQLNSTYLILIVWCLKCYLFILIFILVYT